MSAAAWLRMGMKPDSALGFGMKSGAAIQPCDFEFLEAESPAKSADTKLRSVAAKFPLGVKCLGEGKEDFLIRPALRVGKQNVCIGKVLRQRLMMIHGLKVSTSQITMTPPKKQRISVAPRLIWRMRLGRGGSNARSLSELKVSEE